MWREESEERDMCSCGGGRVRDVCACGERRVRGGTCVEGMMI